MIGSGAITRHWLPVLLTVLTLTLVSAAFAHFKLNLNVRVFHVVHTVDGIDLYMRTPMPYLVADRVGPVRVDGLPTTAPYTTTRLEDGAPMHLVDPAALAAEPLGLGRLAADALRLEAEGQRLDAEVVAVRVHPIGREPGFATRAEAESALAGGPIFPADAGPTYVGDAVVDIRLHMASGGPVGAYRLSVEADPGLPGQEQTANLVLDYAGGATRTYRAMGLMAAPVEVSGSAIAAASTFVLEGIHHILEGLDHVLFVLCMIIGAATLRSLVGRVTGFTIGHTVTLILGFFGLAPQGAWFIPAVETSIALSIIFAAGDAILRAGPDRARDSYAPYATGAIGLLHGLGFSFVLHNILRVDAPNVWQSLLAFNVGVEIGQLIIVAATWPLVLVLRARPEPVWRLASATVAILASLIAASWVFERAGALFA